MLATYKEDTVTAPQNSTHRPAEQRVLISAPQRSNKQSGIVSLESKPLHILLGEVKTSRSPAEEGDLRQSGLQSLASIVSLVSISFEL